MSVLFRCLRHFHDGADAVTLEKELVLADARTRLDLRRESVEDALTAVGVTLCPPPDAPGIRPPSVDVVLRHEPLASAEMARSSGWRENTSTESQNSTTLRRRISSAR